MSSQQTKPIACHFVEERASNHEAVSWCADGIPVPAQHVRPSRCFWAWGPSQAPVFKGPMRTSTTQPTLRVSV